MLVAVLVVPSFCLSEYGCSGDTFSTADSGAVTGDAGHADSEPGADASEAGACAAGFPVVAAFSACPAGVICDDFESTPPGTIGAPWGADGDGGVIAALPASCAPPALGRQAARFDVLASDAGGTATSAMTRDPAIQSSTPLAVTAWLYSEGVLADDANGAPIAAVLLVASGGAAVVVVRASATKIAAAYSNGTETAAGAATTGLAPGSWHCLQLRLDPQKDLFEIRFDSEVVAQPPSGKFDVTGGFATGVHRVELGLRTAASSSPSTLYVDHVRFGATTTGALLDCQ